MWIRRASCEGRIEFSAGHHGVGFFDGGEELAVGVDDEEDGLDVVVAERSFEDGVQVEVAELGVAAEGVAALFVG
ncbi:MAG: hypothetical protein JOZ93_17435, partial [Sinobacteraceae bacterium]|nr:hypothetical protein [Nevskiaceae bacterium]